MKIVLRCFLLACLVSLASPISAAPKKKPTTRPSSLKVKTIATKTLPGRGLFLGWKLYAKPIVLDVKRSKNIITQMQSPTAAAMHLFASLFRKDFHFHASLSPRMKHKVRDGFVRQFPKSFQKTIKRLHITAFITRKMARKKRSSALNRLLKDGYRAFGPFQAMVYASGGSPSTRMYLYLDNENGFWRIKGMAAQFASYLLPADQRR